MSTTTITADKKKMLTFALLAVGVAMVASVMAAPTAAFADGGDHYDYHDDGHHHHHHHDGDHDHHHHKHHNKDHDHNDDYDW
jgi:Ni/Co efflux regulator RcnB